MYPYERRWNLQDRRERDMSAHKYTEQEVLDAYHKCGKNKAHVGRLMGMARSSVQEVLARAERMGLKPAVECKIPEGHILKGKSTLYGADGGEIVTWVKTSADEDKMREALLSTVEALKEDIPKEKPIKKKPETHSDLLSCYVITDYHIGQFSWFDETKEEWNLQIAERLLINWFKQAIESSPPAKECILAQLGDFLHADSIMPITPTSGHILDADGRYAEVVAVVVRVVRQIINMLLQKHEIVHVLMAEGNHDISSSVWLRVLFAEKYSNEPRVKVDQTHTPYYAHEWGKTSIFFHHGHKRNIKEVSKVFAGMYREIYGRTKYSYAHMGHLHHVDVKEDQTMIVEQHPTLAAKDAHSARGGYASLRGASVITYHKNFGEVSRVTIRPEMIDAKSSRD